jgi:group I intron endonuclease
MYLSIILIPIITSILSGIFGRKLGAQGSQFITTFGLMVLCVLSLTALYEVGFSQSPVSTFYKVGLQNIPISIDLFSASKVDLVSMTVIPVKIYENAHSDKLCIIKENKNKAGIYLWTHKESGNTYVGSAKDLSKRLRNYYSISYMTYKNSGNSYINNALLNHGYSNFSLSILEYIDISNLSVSESRKSILEREQHYLDLLNPVYNILKKAGSPLGFKHSESTLTNFSKARKGLTKSEDHKAALKEARKGIIYFETHKKNMSLANGFQIDVYSSDGNTLINSFSSARKAALHFKVSKERILRYARSGKLFLNKWILCIKPKNKE